MPFTSTLSFMHVKEFTEALVLWINFSQNNKEISHNNASKGFPNNLLLPFENQ